MSLQRAAHLLSYLLHPLILMILTIIFLSLLSGSPPIWAAFDVLILVAGLVPGLVYVFVRTRNGQFSHYHLLLKEERYVVFPIMLAGLIGVLVTYTGLDRPSTLVQGVVLGLIVGAGAAMINRFWKISIHAGVGAGCAALLLPVSFPLSALMLSLALISGTARLPIKHHTPAQIVFGWCYGLGLTVVLMRIFF
jgi:hypothetical protein